MPPSACTRLVERSCSSRWKDPPLLLHRTLGVYPSSCLQLSSHHGVTSAARQHCQIYRLRVIELVLPMWCVMHTAARCTYGGVQQAFQDAGVSEHRCERSFMKGREKRRRNLSWERRLMPTCCTVGSLARGCACPRLHASQEDKAL